MNVKYVSWNLMNFRSICIFIRRLCSIDFYIYRLFSHKNDNYNKCLSVKKQNQKVLLGKTSLVTTLSHIIERLCEQYMHTKESVISETWQFMIYFNQNRKVFKKDARILIMYTYMKVICMHGSQRHQE